MKKIKWLSFIVVSIFVFACNKEPEQVIVNYGIKNHVSIDSNADHISDYYYTIKNGKMMDVMGFDGQVYFSYDSNNQYITNDEKYIYFYENDNGGISTKFDNLSAPNVSHTYYDVQNCIYVYEDDNSKKICDVFKFTFIDANTIKCYCYEDGRTYTLYRE